MNNNRASARKIVTDNKFQERNDRMNLKLSSNKKIFENTNYGLKAQGIDRLENFIDKSMNLSEVFDLAEFVSFWYVQMANR